MKRSDEDALVMGVLILWGMSTLLKQSIPWGAGWHWPVPTLLISNPDGSGTPIAVYPPAISQEFKPATHRGLDIMYKRQPASGNRAIDTARFPPNVTDAQGARQHARFFAPMNTPILAAKDGKVWSVRNMPGRGWFVVLDHGKPWATLYGHLHTVSVSPIRGTAVKAGEQIGTMGFAPDDGEKLRHLHFEAWLNGADFRAGQDSGDVIESWERGAWTL